MTLTPAQIAILIATKGPTNRSGFYRGTNPDVEALVALDLMTEAGTHNTDPVYRLTATGHAMLRHATSQDQHGVRCPKMVHTTSHGYHHFEDDDTPFLHNSILYCGRCHRVL